MTKPLTQGLSGEPGPQAPRASGRDILLRTPIPTTLALAGYGPRDVIPAGQIQRRATVSVVVPCFNYGHYLPACVSSIVDQPGVDVEVIIIDDASTDDSADVAREIAAVDPRVIVTAHEVNAGHIATYNEGIAMASGEFIAVLSADDLLTPGALQRAVALLQNYPTMGLAYGCISKWPGGPLPPARVDCRKWAIWNGQDWLADICRVGLNPISPQAVMRTEIVKRIGGFRSDLPHSADFMLWLNLAVVSDVGLMIGTDQAYYRQHESSMSRTTYAGWLTDLRERVRTFDILFAEPPGVIQHNTELRSKVRATLGREARQHGREALLLGEAEQMRAFEEIADALDHARTHRHRIDEPRAVQVMRLKAGSRLNRLWRDGRYKRQRLVGVY